MKHYFMAWIILLIPISLSAQMAQKIRRSIINEKLKAELNAKALIIKQKATFMYLVCDPEFDIEIDGEAAQAFINAGVNVNLRLETTNQTALMRAVIAENIQLVSFLLGQSDINIELKDNCGKSAFDFAKEHQDKTLYKMLLLHRATYYKEYPEKIQIPKPVLEL